MDKETRNAIERATQRARKLLEKDFEAQLDGDFDIGRNGVIAATPGPHLKRRQAFQRERVVAAIEHKAATGMSAKDAISDYLRDSAFTTLNRIVALKMLEARGLVQECISKGEQSAGYREFCGLAPGLPLLSDSAGYRVYVESLFDEMSTEVKVLFDRRDPSSVLWPKRGTFEQLLELLNAGDLTDVWGEDETIGWVYQYFNDTEERREMRESQAPRTSRELAIRNQFFTPKYVVEFLVQNTIGALWVEMTNDRSVLRALPLLIPRRHTEGRVRKDPRELRVLDPACGSGHFLLCAFDVLCTIYREAWELEEAPTYTITGRTLRNDYPSLAELELEIPRLILAHNLFGIDIDQRCAQIAALALWMRAQRSWNAQKVSRSERPSVARTNIVIAEPLPVGAHTRGAFIRSLDAELAPLAESLFKRLDLAGEAGSLLDVHEWFRSEIREVLGAHGELFAQSDEERWHAAEAALLERLREFAEKSHSRREWHRSLFADDAVRGLAFLDITRLSFDVVLMNPPFGDPTARSRAACGPELSISSNDIGAAFVLAAKRRWAPNGCVGVLSSTALWFKPTVADWRREALIGNGYSIRAAAHLGGEVLDGATVSASAIVIDRVLESEQAIFVRLLFVRDKAKRLSQAISAVRHGSADELVFLVAPREFSRFRGLPLAYWISHGLRSRLASFPALEGNGAEVRQGVEPPGDFRFVAAWWEVPVDEIGIGRKWIPFAKSSEYSPLWDDITWVIRWAAEGRELWAFERIHPAPPARHARGAPSISYFGRPGVTYPARAVLGFNPRAFPAGSGFGHMGAVAFPVSVDARALLGYLVSRPLEYVLSFSNGSLQGKKGSYPNHYEVGQIKDLPWPPWSHKALAELQRFGDELASGAMRLQCDDETTHQYTGRPGLAKYQSVQAVIEDSIRQRSATLNAIRTGREELDRLVALELGFDKQDLEEMAREFSRCENPTTGVWSPAFGQMSADLLRDEAESLASELFGFAIGRLDVRPALCDKSVSDGKSAFDPLPAGAPGLLRVVPEGYPLPVPPDGTLIVDPGSKHDIGRAIRNVTAALWGDRASVLEHELAALLGFEQLSGYYESPSQEGFFSRHLTRYAKGRRTAPIYWRIGTASGRYAAFIHYPKVRRDSIFTLIHDHIEPKLARSIGALEELRAEFGPEPNATQRRALVASESLVNELRTLVEELKRVAPLWNPNFDDGVLVNFAPLWRLVPHHRSWQMELKSQWDALCAGEYDWASLAMHLWPERVLPKCATDRSLAIAHGLEDVFWAAGADGKWAPRKTVRRPVEELVRERSSPAVKSALKSLLEAASVIRNGGRSRRGRERLPQASE